MRGAAPPDRPDASTPEPLGGAGRVRRALEVIGAAKQRADLARARCRQ